MIGLGLVLAAAVWFCLRSMLVETDHAFCRRCGFDLFGRYPDLTECPECGAAIHGQRDVRFGRRPHQQRIRRIAWVSGAVALVIAVVTLAAIYRTGRLCHWAPDWVLAYEVTHDTRRFSQAVFEIHQRLERDTLSDAVTQRLVTEALARQADTQRPWQGDWGTIVQLARRMGHVDDATFERYLEEAARDWLQFCIVRLDPGVLEYFVVAGGLRIGEPHFLMTPHGPPALSFRVYSSELYFGERHIRDRGFIQSSGPHTSTGGFQHSVALDPPVSLDVRPRYTATVVVHWSNESMNDPPIFSHTYTLTDPTYKPPASP